MATRNQSGTKAKVSRIKQSQVASKSSLLTTKSSIKKDPPRDNRRKKASSSKGSIRREETKSSFFKVLGSFFGFGNDEKKKTISFQGLDGNLSPSKKTALNKRYNDWLNLSRKSQTHCSFEEYMRAELYIDQLKKSDSAESKRKKQRTQAWLNSLCHQTDNTSQTDGVTPDVRCRSSVHNADVKLAIDNSVSSKLSNRQSSIIRKTSDEMLNKKEGDQIMLRLNSLLKEFFQLRGEKLNPMPEESKKILKPTIRLLEPQTHTVTEFPSTCQTPMENNIDFEDMKDICSKLLKSFLNTIALPPELHISNTVQINNLCYSGADPLTTDQVCEPNSQKKVTFAAQLIQGADMSSSEKRGLTVRTEPEGCPCEQESHTAQDKTWGVIMDDCQNGKSSGVSGVLATDEDTNTSEDLESDRITGEGFEVKLQEQVLTSGVISSNRLAQLTPVHSAPVLLWPLSSDEDFPSCKAGRRPR